MVCKMGDNYIEEMDVEVLPMWPEELKNESGKQFNVERPGIDQDMLEEVHIVEDPSIVDFKRLVELTSYSERGSSQLAFLVKNWEYKQANAVRLLNEELDILSKQRQEAELRKLELEQYRFEEDKHAGDKRSVSILDEVLDIWGTAPRRKSDAITYNQKLEVDAEYDSIKYWKKKSMQLEKMLEASIQREQALQEKLQEIKNYLLKQSSPVEELSQILKRADNFLHFVLQNAPVVIGHQDKDLRYRFIYNHFPSLHEEDIIGRTDVEIFSGAGVKESQDFKKEVMERGQSAKREITFETELFGLKTFLIHAEPVFNKTGETIGVNYMGMDVTDQVIKREKMIKVREQIAVQKAKETELNRTIHITEETMRAKQMLATMSHEIRSPLSGVVSMAEILANTTLDKEQRQLLDVMLSSGDLVLQLINDILDLSKVESGVMKLEAAKFRPREVVKHVLQTAAASLQKELTLEGHIADDVPVEVIGDVLRIRQILTNLISNAIKFTHEGKVGINLHVVPEQSSRQREGCQQAIPEKELTGEVSRAASSNRLCPETTQHKEDPKNYHSSEDGVGKSMEMVASTDEDNEKHNHPHEKVVWLRCDVYDTGIGIPDKALPTLFKKYMQVSADHARKYGGTGLGLAICKQLVELMGGHMTVTSQEKHGSTFTFVLPCKVSPKEQSDDSDEFSDMAEHEAASDANTDEANDGHFYFQPNKLRSMMRTKTLPSASKFCNPLQKLNCLSQESSFPSNSCKSRNSTPFEQAQPIVSSQQTLSESEVLVKQDKDPSTENRSGRAKNHHTNSNGLIMNRYHRPSPDSTTIKSTRDSKTYTETSGEVTNKGEKSGDGKSSESKMLEKNDEDNQSTSSPSMQISESIPQPKILLVEDNKINVMVTQSMMKQLGHTIDVVNNGLEAIHAVQNSRYDLILMDVCMPVMDGLKATRLIRSFEENGNWDAAVEAGIELPTACVLVGKPPVKRIVIIAMTANALAESAAECLANGMDSFVSKPVTFQKLKHCLQQYLPSLKV